MPPPTGIRTPRADPVEDELLAALIVAFAVDHRQSQRCRTSGQVHVLHVELVIVVHSLHLAAVRISIGSDWRVFIQRNRVRLAAIVQRAERAIDVNAR
jgi:hypothetical protein